MEVVSFTPAFPFWSWQRMPHDQLVFKNHFRIGNRGHALREGVSAGAGLEPGLGHAISGLHCHFRSGCSERPRQTLSRVHFATAPTRAKLLLTAWEVSLIMRCGIQSTWFKFVLHSGPCPYVHNRAPELESR
jgi:hypothetical protein